MLIPCHRTNPVAAILFAMTMFFALLVNGASLQAEPAPLVTFSPTALANDEFLISLADTPDVQPSESDADSSLQLAKDPDKALLLGGLLGFGSGQFYSKRWFSGTTFCVIDGFSLMGVGMGIAMTHDDENIFSETLGDVFGYSFIIASSAVLLISHSVQAVWGPRSARKYNEKMEKTAKTWGPFVAPAEESVLVGLTYRY